MQSQLITDTLVNLLVMAFTLHTAPTMQNSSKVKIKLRNGLGNMTLKGDSENLLLELDL